MLFNSLEFAAFFAIFYVAYLLLFRWRRLQNVLLLVASYVFYGWWDWRFLSLIAISTVVDYAVGRGLAKRTAGGRGGRHRGRPPGLFSLCSRCVLSVLSVLSVFGKEVLSQSC